MYDATRDSKGYADQLNIETPEQVELRFPIAGIGSRFLALITDSVIQAVALIALFLCFVLMVSAFPKMPGGSASVSSTAGKWFIAGMILFYFLLFWGYYSCSRRSGMGRLQESGC